MFPPHFVESPASQEVKDQKEEKKILKKNKTKWTNIHKHALVWPTSVILFESPTENRYDESVVPTYIFR